MAVTMLPLLFLALLIDRGDTTHWGYTGSTGPSFWKDLNISGNQCGSTRRQSPVDIVSEWTVYNPRLREMRLNKYDEPLVRPYIVNNGHTAMVVEEDSERSLEHGGLPGRYTFAQFHFHWGANSSRGSEHFIDGRQFPMEMHLVHYKSDYGTTTEALKYPDGLVVLAVYFEVGKKNNRQYRNIVNELQKVRTKTDRGVPVQSEIVLDSLLPQRSREYFTYNGSLTTPPCSETAIFTVFREAVSLSEEQIDQFRKLRTGDQDSERLVDNFRPPLPLRGRTVQRNFRSGAGLQTEGIDEDKCKGKRTEESSTRQRKGNEKRRTSATGRQSSEGHWEREPLYETRYSGAGSRDYNAGRERGSSLAVGWPSSTQLAQMAA